MSSFPLFQSREIHVLSQPAEAAEIIILTAAGVGDQSDFPSLAPCHTERAESYPLLRTSHVISFSQQLQELEILLTLFHR